MYASVTDAVLFAIDKREKKKFSRDHVVLHSSKNDSFEIITFFFMFNLEAQ